MTPAGRDCSKPSGLQSAVDLGPVLRHTAASLFAASGMPLARVARVLGHADTGTTYKVYLHFFPDDFAADMDRLDEYIAPNSQTPSAPTLTLRAE